MQRLMPRASKLHKRRDAWWIFPSKWPSVYFSVASFLTCLRSTPCSDVISGCFNAYHSYNFSCNSDPFFQENGTICTIELWCNPTDCNDPAIITPSHNSSHRVHRFVSLPLMADWWPEVAVAHKFVNQADLLRFIVHFTWHLIPVRKCDRVAGDFFFLHQETSSVRKFPQNQTEGVDVCPSEEF